VTRVTRSRRIEHLAVTTKRANAPALLSLHAVRPTSPLGGARSLALRSDSYSGPLLFTVDPAAARRSPRSALGLRNGTAVLGR
jgi:hypothetical protein